MQTTRILNLGREQATPHRPAERVDTSALPAKMRNYPFFYVCYPTGWEFLPDRGFVPVLNEVTQRPGVNGVDEHGDPSKAVAGSMKKGGVIIRAEDPRLGPWQGYLMSYPCQKGRHYCFMAAEFAVLPGGRVSEKDYSAELLDFRVYLRDHRIVEPMHVSVYQLLLEREQKGLERLRKEASQQRRRPEDVAAKEARIESLQAAWVAYCERWYVPTDAPEPEAAPASTTPARALKARRERTITTPTEAS